VLQEELERSNVDIILVNEDLDSSDMGKLITYIKGFSAKLEAEQIRERTMRGKKILLQQGILPQGTGKGLFGYQWDKRDKKRVPIGFEAKVVERIFTMLSEGVSVFRVAQILNEQGIPCKAGGKWEPRNISRMAENTAYIGLTYFGKTHRNGKGLEDVPEEKWQLLKKATPAIISKDVFERANKALKRSKELHLGRTQNEYLLTGFIKCGLCNNHLVGSCLHHKYKYYHCRGTYPTSTRGAVCTAGYISAIKLEDIVWSKVLEIVSHPEMILAELERRASDNYSGNGKSLNKQIASIEKRLDKYQAEEKQLIKLFRHKDIDENTILDEIAQLKKDRKEDEDKLTELTWLKEQTVDINLADKQIREYCNKVKQNLDNCSFQNKRIALDALDIQVIATKDKVEIKASVPFEFDDSNLVSKQTVAWRSQLNAKPIRRVIQPNYRN